MFALVYLTLSVVGVLLEATLLPLPLGLVFIVLRTVQGSPPEAERLPPAPRLRRAGKAQGRWLLKIWQIGEIGSAFLVGVLADILMLRPVGATGLIYGVVVILLRLYSRKFEVARLAYLLPFSAAVVGLYSRFFYLVWRQQVVIALAVIVIVRWVTGIGQRKYDRLRVETGN